MNPARLQPTFPTSRSAEKRIFPIVLRRDGRLRKGADDLLLPNLAKVQQVAQLDPEQAHVTSGDCAFEADADLAAAVKEIGRASCRERV